MNLQDINIYWIMIGLSLTIILSYSFNYISKKTRIPSVILLILTGFIASFFIPLEMEVLRPFLTFLGAVGLIMIVLEASLDLDLKREKTGIILKALFSAIILLVLGAVIIAWIIAFFFEIGIIQALFYAIPLSIMSSAIIIPSVHHLGENRREFLIYESAFSDILGIMFFYFLEASLSKNGAGEVTTYVLGNIGITLVVALALGILVIFLIERVRAQVKLFLPIAVLILLYSVGKLFHLSSLIFILVFGLMINNRKLFFRGFLDRLILSDHFEDTFDDLKTLTLESSFIVRTFFFIVFGMTITGGGLNDPMIYVIGLGALVILHGTRFGLISVLIRKTKFPAIFVAPRGLITILLFFGIPESQIIADFNPAILLIVILGSNLVMTYGLMKFTPVSERGESGDDNDTEEIPAGGYEAEESHDSSSGSPGEPPEDISGTDQETSSE